MRTQRILSVILGLAIVAWSSGFSFAATQVKAAESQDERPTFLGSPDDVRKSGLRGDDLKEAISKQAAELKAADTGGTVNATGSPVDIEASATAPTITETFIQASATLTGLKDQASDNGGHICSIYLDTRDGMAAGASGSIYARCSVDNGASWLSEKRLDGTGTGKSGTGMTITSDGTGSFFVFFDSYVTDASGDIYTNISRDGGQTWSGPILVNAADSDGTPVVGVASPDGHTYAAYAFAIPAFFITGIGLAHSSDHGATWGSGIVIDDVGFPTISTETGPLIMMSANGRVNIVWTSTRSGGTDIFMDTSSDFGATAGTDIRGTLVAGSTVWNYDICSDYNGNAYVLHEVSSSEELRLARSTDYGASFAVPVNIIGGTATDGGGEISLNCTYGAGVHRVILGFEGGAATDLVYSVASNDGGATFTAPTNIDFGGSVDEISDLAGDVDANGKVVFAWTQDRLGGSSESGFLNYSSDGGATWLTPDVKFTSPALGAHDIDLTDDEQGTPSEANTGKGAENQNRLVFHLTWNDNRAAGVGMWYGKAKVEGTKTALTRHAGANRRDTARKICQDGFPNPTASAFVVARHDNPADALSGAPLAVKAGGCLLLTTSTSLSSEVSTEIARAFDGKDDPLPDVYMMGGGAALNASLEAAIQAIHPNIDIKRLAGTDRIHTSVLTAEEIKSLHGQASSAVFIANSTATFDALSAGAAASNPQISNGPAPVLLTRKDSLDSRVAAFLSSNSSLVKKAYLAGGSAVLASGASSAIDAIIDSVTQFGGTNRYHTAQLIGDFFFPDPQSIGLASGTVPWDALPGGAHSGKKVQPLLLVQPCGVPSQTDTYVLSHASTIDGGDVYGGTAAICDTVKSSIESKI